MNTGATQMTAAKFATKTAAEQVAAKFPCGVAVWIGPAFAKAEGVSAPGWYVRVLRRLVTAAEAV